MTSRRHAQRKTKPRRSFRCFAPAYPAGKGTVIALFAIAMLLGGEYFRPLGRLRERLMWRALRQRGCGRAADSLMRTYGHERLIEFAAHPKESPQGRVAALKSLDNRMVVFSSGFLQSALDSAFHDEDKVVRAAAAAWADNLAESHWRLAQSVAFAAYLCYTRGDEGWHQIYTRLLDKYYGGQFEVPENPRELRSLMPEVTSWLKRHSRYVLPYREEELGAPLPPPLEHFRYGRDVIWRRYHAEDLPDVATDPSYAD